MTSPAAQADVRLRRRLSDKDKERRLVRRSSSKRKDKENGGSGGTEGKAGNGNDSPARVSLQASADMANDPGVPSDVMESGSVGGHLSGQLITSSSEHSTVGTRGALKRTSSAEASNNSNHTSGGIPHASAVSPAAVQQHQHAHALLCRTRSEDATGSSAEMSEAGLTRSLPRI